jgi:hypothetical protein
MPPRSASGTAPAGRVASDWRTSQRGRAAAASSTPPAGRRATTLPRTRSVRDWGCTVSACEWRARGHARAVRSTRPVLRCESPLDRFDPAASKTGTWITILPRSAPQPGANLDLGNGRDWLRSKLPLKAGPWPSNNAHCGAGMLGVVLMRPPNRDEATQVMTVPHWIARLRWVGNPLADESIVLVPRATRSIDALWT